MEVTLKDYIFANKSFLNVLGGWIMIFFFKYLLLHYYNAYNAHVMVTSKAK